MTNRRLTPWFLVCACVIFLSNPLSAMPDETVAEQRVIASADEAPAPAVTMQRAPIRWPTVSSAKGDVKTTANCARSDCTLYMFCWYGTKECKADYLVKYCADGIEIKSACFCSNC
jgi:hypothetical protein